MFARVFFWYFFYFNGKLKKSYQRGAVIIKKLLFFFLIMFIGVFLWAENVFSLAEKNFEAKKNVVDQDTHLQVYRSVISLLKANELFVAKNYFSKKESSVYATDRYGQVKTYFTLKDNDKQIIVSLKTTVEGPLPQKEAELKAQELGWKIISDFEKQ